MLVTLWSAKGGVGTTVVSVMLAAHRAAAAGQEVVVVDLGGDVPAALGAVAPTAGVVDWLSAPETGIDALERLTFEAAPGLHVLPRGGEGIIDSVRIDALIAHLASLPRLVIADVGTLPVASPAEPLAETGRALAASATRSLLVTRACYLALRRADRLPLQPSGVVLVAERGRALGRRDVETCVGSPVVAEIAVDVDIARTIDAGLVGRRLPKKLGLALDGFAA